MTQQPPPSGCCAILLAAGRGSRFGGDKLLAPFRGVPLLEYPLRVLSQAREEGLIGLIVVVLPSGATKLVTLAEAHRAEVATQPDPEGNQANSLRVGLAVATGADAVMVVLGDQPLLSLDTIRQLRATAMSRPDAIIRPRYSEAPDTPGHPVIIPATWWHLNESPDGFRGTTASGVPSVEVAIQGRNPDVDTPEVLRSLHDISG